MDTNEEELNKRERDIYVQRLVIGEYEYLASLSNKELYQWIKNMVEWELKDLSTKELKHLVDLMEKEDA